MNRHSIPLPSIAVSAQVRPSRILSWAMLLYCLALLLASLGIAFSWLGELPLLVRLLVVFLTLFALWRSVNWLTRQRKIIRLDISTNGQIRLVEHNGLTDLTLLCPAKAGGDSVLRLMPDSVLWPGLLLLRLEN